MCALAGDAAAEDLAGPIRAPSPGETLDAPAEIVRIARAEFNSGVREIPRGSNNSARIARYRGALSPRPRGGPWCVYFASWVALRAGVPIGSRGRGLAGVAGVRTWARRTGRWRRVPRPGDIAVYPNHAGIVVAVNGSRMTTIEGNWSDRVSRLSRSRREAVGFARPAARRTR